MLEHNIHHQQHTIADTDAEGAAAAAFADDDDDDGYSEGEHLAQVHGDRFTDVSLFGIDTGKGTLGIDETDDRQSGLVGQLHQTQGLAIAFREHRAVVPALAFLGVAAFLLADDHDAVVIDSGKTANQRLVVGEMPVTAEFEEVGADALDIIEGVWSLDMARQLDTLPW